MLIFWGIFSHKMTLMRTAILIKSRLWQGFSHMCVISVISWEFFLTWDSHETLMRNKFSWARPATHDIIRLIFAAQAVSSRMILTHDFGPPNFNNAWFFSIADALGSLRIYRTFPRFTCICRAFAGHSVSYLRLFGGIVFSRKISGNFANFLWISCEPELKLLQRN